MKTTALFIAILTCLNLSAQKNDDSLQESLNKSQETEKSKIVNFEANVNLAQNAVQLKWETTPNSSTAQYIIEKSIDKNS